MSHWINKEWDKLFWYISSAFKKKIISSLKYTSKVNAIICYVVKISEDSSESKILLAINDTLLTTPVNVIGKDMFDHIDLPVEISNISSMVYNPVNKTIILYEGNSKKIVEFDPETKKVSTLVNYFTQVVSIDLGNYLNLK